MGDRIKGRWAAQGLAAIGAIGLLGAGVAGATEPAQPRCLADLPAAIAQWQRDPRWARSHWGFLARTLDPANPQTLIQGQAQQFFVPASNAKLFSTAAALAALGPEFRSPTRAYWRPKSATQPRPAWWIVPGGDPTITHQQLQAWADRLATLHPPTEALDVVVFDRSETPPSWEWDDLTYGYAPVVNRAMVDRNAVSLTFRPQFLDGAPSLEVQTQEPVEGLLNWFQPREFQALPADAEPTWQLQRDRQTGLILFTGGLPMGTSAQAEVAHPRPGQKFAWLIADRLSEQFFRQVRSHPLVAPPPPPTVNWQRSPLEVAPLPAPAYDRFRNPPVVPIVNLRNPPGPLGQPTAELASANLTAVISQVNQASDNLGAEALLRWLDPDRPMDRLTTVLTDLGLDPTAYRLVDGAGLSRQNLVSPEAIVQLLTIMARSPHAQIYENSLPIAGETGTLANRFRDTPLAGQLRAKTGTLTGVAALSGYLNHPEWGPVAFSLIIDHANTPTRDLRAALDQVVLWLYGVRSCAN